MEERRERDASTSGWIEISLVEESGREEIVKVMSTEAIDETEEKANKVRGGVEVRKGRRERVCEPKRKEREKKNDLES